MIYVIYNGIDEELRTRKVVKIMEKMLKRVNQSQVLSDMEYARKVYLATEQEEKDEYYEMGERKGMEKGMQQGMEQERINSIISFCHLKYPRKNFMWVKDCSMKQLEEIKISIVKDQIDYDTFYQKIQAIV